MEVPDEGHERAPPTLRGLHSHVPAVSGEGAATGDGERGVRRKVDSIATDPENSPCSGTVNWKNMKLVQGASSGRPPQSRPVVKVQVP